MSQETDVITGMMLGGTVGQWRAASAKADAMRQQAELDFQRAEEILTRNRINNEAIYESALSFTGTQRAIQAGQGRSGETASDQAAIERTIELATKQIKLNDRAAQWEARMARLGAKSQLESADATEVAGKTQAASDFAMTLARMFATGGA